MNFTRSLSFTGIFALFLAGCTTSPGDKSSHTRDSAPIAQGTRRVATGHDSNKKAIFLFDGQPERVVTTETLPGLELIELWATEETPKVPVLGLDPTLAMKSFVPGPGGSRFRIFRLPGLSERPFDAQAFQREFASKAPGLANAMEEDGSGMHTTDTVDYAVILSGAVTLELDDGRKVRLKTGDCIIQNGTRHAWRNVSREPCVIAVVMVGAVRGTTAR